MCHSSKQLPRHSKNHTLLLTLLFSKQWTSSTQLLIFTYACGPFSLTQLPSYLNDRGCVYKRVVWCTITVIVFFFRFGGSAPLQTPLVGSLPSTSCVDRGPTLVVFIKTSIESSKCIQKGFIQVEYIICYMELIISPS